MIRVILKEFSLLCKTMVSCCELLFIKSTVLWSVQRQLVAQVKAVVLTASLPLCKAL